MLYILVQLTKTLNKSLVSKMHTNMSQLADKQVRVLSKYRVINTVETDHNCSSVVAWCVCVQMLSVRDVWPGLPVAVYVSEESLWFRAVVQQLQTGAKGSTQVTCTSLLHVVIEEQKHCHQGLVHQCCVKVKVFLVDYGDHEVVSLANVRPLPAQFTSLPSQAVRTRLAGECYLVYRCVLLHYLLLLGWARDRVRVIRFEFRIGLGSGLLLKWFGCVVCMCYEMCLRVQACVQLIIVCGRRRVPIGW